MICSARFVMMAFRVLRSSRVDIFSVKTVSLHGWIVVRGNKTFGFFFAPNSLLKVIDFNILGCAFLGAVQCAELALWMTHLGVMALQVTLFKRSKRKYSSKFLVLYILREIDETMQINNYPLRMLT